MECKNAVCVVNAARVLEYFENIKRLVSKLPFYVQERWRNIVMNKKEASEPVTFTHLVDFAQREARKKTDPVYGQLALATKSREAKPTRGGHPQRHQVRKIGCACGVAESSRTNKKYASPESSTKPAAGTASSKPCIFCEGPGHMMQECRKLKAKPQHDRLQFLKTKGLCFGCLKGGHLGKQCRTRAKSEDCGALHSTVLNQEREQEKTEESPKQETPKNTEQGSSCSTFMAPCKERASSHMGAGTGLCTMAIIPVRVRSPTTNTTVQTYAFLDPGSNVTFCTEDLAHQLGVTGKATTMELQTMGQTQNFFTRRIAGLEVSGPDSGPAVKLPMVYTKHEMPVTRDLMPVQEDVDRFEHQRGIKLPVIQAEVGMLIGNNVPAAKTPQELKTGPVCEPPWSQVSAWIDHMGHD